MILKRTDEYSFVSGNGDARLGSKAPPAAFLLKNNAEDRHEIWLGCEPQTSDIMWCRWNRPVWMAFDHVASRAEVDEYHTF